ncbi:hypothetical protein L2E82_13935 [Cichorium intybus]|uniref:Uncharacterized protein n=1 Tax=Cichorium intybus TaxID=13427 RepID=A0ACB9EYL0_CICIN|nr:hypothetical protein L2E82_13935 [Cichorium intybus]
MKLRHRSSEIISSLPQNTIDKVMALMPIRDALINSIFLVLLLHKGPILDFSISISDKETVNELDQIILHLSNLSKSCKYEQGRRGYKQSQREQGK